MKRFYFLAALALIALPGLWLFLPAAPAANDAPAPSATVSTVTVMRQILSRQVETSGSIVAGGAEQSLTLNAAAILTAYDVVQGEAVQAGQPLAALAPDPAEAANLAKARDAVAAAQAARDHIASLLPARLATMADLARATQALQDAKASLAAVRASFAGQAFTLYAPQAGLITALAAAPGGSLPAGTTLLKFVPASALAAQAGLTQGDAALVRPGDAASLTLLNTGGKVPATVTSVAAALDPQTGLIAITLRPQAPVALGAPVAVSIEAGQFDGFPVPNSAVLRDEAGSYIYQLDTQNIAHRQNVTVLQQGTDETVLAPTLNPAWRVATIGAYQLSDGMRATLQGAGS